MSLLLLRSRHPKSLRALLLLLVAWATGWGMVTAPAAGLQVVGAACGRSFHAGGALPTAAAYRRPTPSNLATCSLAGLPREAQQTYRLILRGGPFPYRRDGIIFGNRERLLPQRARGYYREYTVPTPGARTRGARRIIRGQGGEMYYTEDHYRSFRRIEGRQ